MKRRFNYTGRKRIPRKNISIILIKDTQGKVKAFNATINLNTMNLEHDAEVYVEVYRRYELKRFKWGTVRDISPPPDTLLTDFNDTDNLKFRILVVDKSGIDGKVLAHADRITPEATPDKKSIFPVSFDDLGQQIWNVEYTADEGAPRLVINEKIPNIQNVAKSDPRFRMDVFPSALREVLIHMIFIDGIDSISDPPVDWHRDWLNFASLILPESLPQEIYNPGESSGPDVKNDWFDWIDKVVAEFCSQRKEWWDYIQVVEGGEER